MSSPNPETMARKEARAEAILFNMLVERNKSNL